MAPSSWFQRANDHRARGDAAMPSSSSTTVTRRGGDGGSAAAKKRGSAGPVRSSSNGKHGSLLQSVIAACLHPRPPLPASSSGGFSPLLLEHGEQVLMDWAVVVSTTAASADAANADAVATTENGGYGNVLSQGSGGDFASSGSSVQWAQSSASSSTPSSSSRQQQRQHEQRHRSPTRTPPLPSSSESKESCPATSRWTRVEARLHLCSRSIVIEPTGDPSTRSNRPMVRCPLVRLAGPPASPDASDGDDTGEIDDEAAAAAAAVAALAGSHHPSDAKAASSSSAASLMGFEPIGGTCRWTSHRYLVIQQHCAGPFEVVTVPTAFGVTLLHSSPRPLAAVGRLLYLHLHPPVARKQLHKSPRHHHNNNNGGPSSAAVGSAPSSATAPAAVSSSLIRPADRPALEQAMENLVDWREQVVAHFSCSVLAPLHEQAGVLCITGERLYFSASPLELVVTTASPVSDAGGGGIGSAGPVTVDHTIRLGGNRSSPPWSRVGKWNRSSLVAYARRYHGLRDTAVELYFADGGGGGADSSTSRGHSVLIALRRRHDRELVVRHLDAAFSSAATTAVANPSSASDAARGSLPLVCFTSREFVKRAFEEWQQGLLSNFDYLLALNSAAGRNYHDLSRYPVFPWVIRDYESATLDLTKPETFRDLTKPVGALNSQRLEYFQKRMASMHDMPGGEPFLYGTHYSAPGYVLYYLVRSMPEHMLCLQNGKFDAADRMFHSLGQCFQCVMTNHADVKEVLPEFYHASTSAGGSSSTNFDFLLNTRGLQLGATQLGDRVDDVLLPPWAKSARDFLRKNRKALESPLCTQSLPSWIDLIFGCRSRGEAALQANNLFHSSSYLSPVDLDSKSEDERAQLELQATEFGIVPDQLFTGPHPRRDDSLPVDPDSNFIADIGRASSEDPSSTSVGAGGGAWELLDHPPPSVSESSSITPVVDAITVDPRRANDASADALARDTVAPLFGDESEVTGPTKSLPLRGKGESATARPAYPNRGFSVVLSSPSSTSHDEPATSARFNPSPPASPQRIRDAAPSEWDMKILERKHVHTDAVSGCSLVLVENRQQPSILATTSLDGGLKVHKVGLGAGGDDQVERKGFPSTLSRFTYSTIMSRSGVGGGPPSYSSGSSLAGSVKLSEYRSHASRDPLACLVLASVDGEPGHVAFAGGHDDVILAYGIHSACAVASIYSHRDAVTGLDLLPRKRRAHPQSLNSYSPSSALWLEKSTHVMVSGSWDATVKVWSATVSSGEAVAIHREPLAELFDADSSIVCVTAIPTSFGGEGVTDSDIDADDDGIVIAAGCADGSFCVWNVHSDGMQVVLHKEPARRGSGPCSVVKWVDNGDGRLALFAAFSTGVVASYALFEGGLHRMSAVSIGVAILSLVHADGHLWLGSSDGALRLIPVREGGYFDKPTLWTAVNHKASPGITSISVTPLPKSTTGASANVTDFVCCTGGEDGSVALFELRKRSIA